MDTPLTPLQQAYLLGRSDRWPLGGVAMHDFREYCALRPDLARLEARLGELIAHYPALRTCIDARRGVQRVCEGATPPLDYFDFRTLDDEAADREVDALRARYSHQMHDPALPPWRIAVIRLGEREDRPGSAYDTLIFTSFDALILDGSGIASVIARLFDELPLPADAAAALPPPEASDARREADAAWWRARLRDVTTPSSLPWRAPLSGIKTSRYRRASLTISRDTLRQLGRLGSPHALLRNSLLSTLVLDTLQHWTQDGELCVGVPVAFPAAGGALGNASSFIALRYPGAGDDFIARARRLQDDVLSALDHLAFSGVDLARELLARSGGGPALPVILTNCLGWETLPAGGPVRYLSGLTQTPQVAIDIRLTLDCDKNLLLCVDYAERALAPEQIEAMLAALARRIDACCRRETLAIPSADFIDLSHYRHNGAPADAASPPWLAELAGRLFDPENGAAALICGERVISYRALGQQVAAVIANLQQRGLGQGSAIALYLPRGPELAILSVACALLGAVWVPLDIHSPPARAADLIDNCRPDLVVRDDGPQAPDGVTPQRLLAPPDNPAALPDAQALAARSVSEAAAYYLYTSGTTGAPKCVVLNYRATGNVIARTRRRWAVTADDVLISVTPPHHDMAMFDLFGALSAGAALVLPAPDEEKDAIRWNRLVARHGVTVWCSVPAILEMLLACRTADSLRSLRLVAQGGDYIKPETVRALRTLHPEPILYSLGGPTETTIWSIWHQIAAEDTGTVPYGQPLPGNDYFICRDDGSHCPTGVIGRIHTAGVNLALGYLEQGALKQHDFVTLDDPAGRPLRAFRTGDRGYYRPDGSIMFAARINGYVKIRGVRVSLPEIEETLRRHPAIADIVVVDYPAAGSGEATLGALYLTRDARPLPRADLRAFAARCLPGTHIPTRFIHALALPLSANGKADRAKIRAALAEPAAADAVPAPSRAGEILGIYCRAIGVTPKPEWGDETPFIAMGLRLGHMKAVAGGLSEAFEVEVTAGELMRCGCVREVEGVLRR